MRFILLFLLFGCTQIGMAQQDFKFDESDYQTMLQKAKTEKKPVFLMLYADWCPHCNKMKNSVLKDVAVIDFLSKNYLCKALNSDLPESTAIKTKFHTTTLPTFLILDSGENELYRLKGEYTTQQFLAEIQNANNPKQQLPYLEKEFTADPSNTQKWMNYMLALRKGYERTYLNEKAKPYFATQTDQQLISRENWQIIANCVTEIPSREFQLVLSHQKEFESVSSPLRVERKIINIASELLKPYTLNLDTLNYYKQREIAQSIQSQKVDSLIFKYDLTIAERTQNWDEYKKVTIDSTKKYLWEDASGLKEIATTYLKNISDKAGLDYAIQWTNRSLILSNSKDGNLLLTQLYIKTKDTQSAKVAAKNTRTFCTQLGFSTKEIDELYTQLGMKI